MMYTFVPKERHAKASGVNLNISTKDAVIVCRKIRGMKFEDAEKFLEDLLAQKRSIDGKYYTKTVREILKLLESCKANAENLGLDEEFLVVHASAHKGPTIRRRRRKADFGNRMKISNIEIMLIEKRPAEKAKGDEVERKAGN